MANHSFLGLIDTLNYLHELGVNAVELMPVNEFEGNDSWGYNPSFYFATDKYYGPADTFKAFIDSAHQRGIAVIMDMVLNHAYGECPLVRMYWDAENGRPAANNPWFNQSSPNPVFSWGYDFNHESEATKSFVDSVSSFWLSEFRIDGFRFDFTKGFTNTPGDGGAYDASRIAILKRMADHIWEVNKKAYVILEHFAVNTEETELANYGMMLWGNMNHAYRIAAKGYLGGGASDLSWISYAERGWNAPQVVGFMESHDEERLMYSCYQEGNSQNINHSVKETPIALQRMEVAANMFIPMPGPKMIWMFGELGYDFSIDYNGRIGRKPIRWDYFDQPARKRLYQVYAALNHLKNSYPVFRSEDFELVVRDTVKRINLNHPDMNVSIMGNFSTWSKLGQTKFQHGGWWYEYWTGDSIFVENTEAWMSFNPSEYRLYTDVKLVAPDIISGVKTRLPAQTGMLTMFPNPAGNQLCLDVPGHSGDVLVQVFDLYGREVLQKILQNGISEKLLLDISSLAKGVLIVKVSGGSMVWTGKILHR
ncbi:MAG: T9SS type A sorting domain-containing protein [Bacteroidales bacterium]|nr:T9SS type A sorting domain-containing protein [Bacteroidales bacterium]